MFFLSDCQLVVFVIMDQFVLQFLQDLINSLFNCVFRDRVGHSEKDEIGHRVDLLAFLEEN